MKIIFLLSLFFILSLGACTKIRDSAGVTRKSIDEFQVIENPPLVIPPDFNLEPPDQLKEKNVTLDITQTGKELLAEKGFDPIFGARPLRRVIQDEIEDMLSEDLLSGDLQPGDSVLIDVEDNKFVCVRNKIIDSEIVPEATSSAV